jgi:hypothetical protein
MKEKVIEYTEEMADKICEALSTRVISVKALCKEEGFPSQSAVYKWLNLYPSFVEKYARAREAQATIMAEEILEIADDTSNDMIYKAVGDEIVKVENREFINRSKIRIDTRKWLMSKLLPKKYGDRIDVTSDNDRINPVTPELLVLIADKINKNAAR